MRGIAFLLIIFVTSSAGLCQVREIFVTDTAYIQLNYLEDSALSFSLKNTRNLKGLWIIYYDNDKQHKALEAVYKKGKLAGSQKQWYEDGKLLSEKKCLNDTCTTEYYYPDGALMRRDIESINSATGNRNWFYSAAYCNNGQIKYAPPLNPDYKEAQLITYYYCSGMKKEESTVLFVNGKQINIRD